MIDVRGGDREGETGRRSLARWGGAGCRPRLGRDEFRDGLFVRSLSRAKAAHLREVAAISHVAPAAPSSPAAIQKREAAVPAGAQADLRQVRGHEQVGRGNGDRPQPTRSRAPSPRVPLPGRAVRCQPAVRESYAYDAMKEGGGGTVGLATGQARRDERVDGAPEPPCPASQAFGGVSSLAGREPGGEEPLRHPPVGMETLVDERSVMLPGDGVQKIEDDVPAYPSKGGIGGGVGGGRTQGRDSWRCNLV